MPPSPQGFEWPGLPGRHRWYMLLLPRNILRKVAATAAGVPCDVVQVEHEHPYETIIDTARKRGCDAIVMATHGRRGVSAVVLGSETVKVLTHSNIPLVVVRGYRGRKVFSLSSPSNLGAGPPAIALRSRPSRRDRTRPKRRVSSDRATALAYAFEPVAEMTSFTMQVSGSLGSGEMENPSSLHIASIALFSPSTWPSMVLRPSARAYSMIICMSR
jgi:Universal stress protein family